MTKLSHSNDSAASNPQSRASVFTPSAEVFAGRCAGALAVVYESALPAAGEMTASVLAESIRYVIRMLAVLIAAERINSLSASSKPILQARAALFEALGDSRGKSYLAYANACEDAAAVSGFGIFRQARNFKIRPEAFAHTAEALLRPESDSPIEPLFFETVPLNWIGGAYQRLCGLRPSADGPELRPDASRRKRRGLYFTPPDLVNYVTESVLTALVDSCVGMFEGAAARQCVGSLALLDPAVGGGDFLVSAVDFLSENVGSDGVMTRSAAAKCVYGVDIDPIAVEVARYCVWAASGYADGVSEAINSRLICADALGSRGESALDWEQAFPEVFASRSAPGFDAVIGNPPYIAAKNGALKKRAPGSGQSDSYLMFLSTIMNGLVKPGGMLSMVLPDPMLVRGNAARIRRKLFTDYTLLSLVHISEAFQDARVANVVPLCRKVPSRARQFCVSRIEKVADRRSFSLRPRQSALEMANPAHTATVLAQQRCEILYLLEDGPFERVIKRIHGESMCLSDYKPPFAPLEKLNIKRIFRGEEVGKAAIESGEGDLPILLGGQSIKPYEITWEGRRVEGSWVRKGRERYLGSKILIQKSSPHLVAALDRAAGRHVGYVFPQSVYGLQLEKDGITELYLLCILNSKVMNEYIWRRATGYKLLQPQIEIEDIRALPIRRINFTTGAKKRKSALAKGLEIFEEESGRWDPGFSFSGFESFLMECLTQAPERSDVVHDLLHVLGGRMVQTAAKSRKSPDVELTRRLESTRAAIETAVWCLYSSEPAQMTLIW